MNHKSCSSTESTTPQPQAAHAQDVLESQLIQTRMKKIKRKILVLSGKGGVGKSTVSVNLAAALALSGNRVGLLDVDIHGPSIPKLLSLENASVTGSEKLINPVSVNISGGALSVMSIGLLLSSRDEAVVWRGPRKFGVIKQFLRDVEWGELDYLIIDFPPGTGDEPLAAVQLIGDADGAVVVTTPQEVSVQDVRRCLDFCQQVNLPVLGVVENMSGFVCPKCNEHIDIFGKDGGKTMANEMNVPYFGEIPIEPVVVASGDAGVPVVQSYPDSQTTKSFFRIVELLRVSESKI